MSATLVLDIRTVMEADFATRVTARLAWLDQVAHVLDAYFESIEEAASA